MKASSSCRIRIRSILHSLGISRRSGERDQSTSTLASKDDLYSFENLHDDAEWQSVIGLEIHAQIKSLSKMFSGAGTQYGASANSQVSFFDAALPGTLPVLNRRCVEAGVLTALALGCCINKVSQFDRKHYFYADLPAGYQITQYRKPLAVNGKVTYVYQDSQTMNVERRTARLTQIQLEQDSGKSLHDEELGTSLIDLNRAGIGLMEIVTDPDFRNGDEAVSFVRDLRDILVAIGTCDGKMAEGSLRVDANISVNRRGQEMGIRTEVKNLNSVRSMRAAINYETRRQIEILKNGGTIENETRSFDLESGQTVPMRDKEKLLDYRFMPEPNLPPLVIHENHSTFTHPDASSSSSPPHAVVLQDVQALLTELPDAKRMRLECSHQQSLLSAMILVRSGLSDLFETMVTEFACDPAAASTVIRNNFRNHLNDNGRPIDKQTLAEVIHLFHKEEISGLSLDIVLREKSSNPHLSVEDIITTKNLWMVKDEALISDVAEDVLTRNPKIVKAFRRGKLNQLKILTTKVVTRLEGKVDPKHVERVVADKLKHSQ